MKRIKQWKLSQMHDLIDYCQLIEHHSHICLWHFKHNPFAICAFLWLQHQSRTLLVYLRWVSCCCSQVNLPVNIRDALCLRCCRTSNCGHNVCLFLLPPHSDSLTGVFFSLDLWGQEIFQLFLVHILRNHFVNEAHAVFNKFVKLVGRDILRTEQVLI